MPLPVLLDTDIASDVDDLLALLMIAGSPELELVGIAATYGDTTLRARIARQVCDDLDLDVPIAAGPTSPLSGAAVWYSGDEQHQLDPAAPAARFEPGDAVELLLTASQTHHPNLAVAAIGPLTNLAVAIDKDPGFAARIGRLFVMGGNFGPNSSPEHNFRSDATAARTVMSAGIPTTIVGLEHTRQVHLAAGTIDQLCATGTAAARYLHHQATRWMSRNGLDHVILHDPAAVMTSIAPTEFTTATGTVEVDERSGASRFTPGEGTIDLVTSTTPERVSKLIADRIRRTLTP